MKPLPINENGLSLINTGKKCSIYGIDLDRILCDINLYT